MLGSESPPIFIGVPIYRGWDYLDDSLRSIQAQEFQNYRVLLSLDGGDERCAKICANYTNDSRFALVIQPHLPKTYVHGATFWLTADKAVIVMTLRGSWVGND